MSRFARTVMSAVLVTWASSVASPIATAATGAQKFDGVIFASGATGTRHVVASPIVGRGVFKGAGRIMEVQNLPGDPDNAARDDLVFAAGRCTSSARQRVLSSRSTWRRVCSAGPSTRPPRPPVVPGASPM